VSRIFWRRASCAPYRARLLLAFISWVGRPARHFSSQTEVCVASVGSSVLSVLSVWTVYRPGGAGQDGQPTVKERALSPSPSLPGKMPGLRGKLDAPASPNLCRSGVPPDTFLHRLRSVPHHCRFVGFVRLDRLPTGRCRRGWPAHGERARPLDGKSVSFRT